MANYYTALTLPVKQKFFPALMSTTTVILLAPVISYQIDDNTKITAEYTLQKQKCRM